MADAPQQDLDLKQTAQEPEAKPAETAAAAPTPPVEAAPAEAKPKETKLTEAPAKVAPEKYEIKIPQGVDQKYVDEFLEYARAMRFSNEEAQRQIDREATIQDRHMKNQQANFDKVKDGWADQAKFDPEIGGDAFARNVEYAKRVVERFGSSEFKKALDETGLGNHPELLRVFSRIGKSMADDRLVISNGAEPKRAKSHAEMLYGGTEPKQQTSN